MSTPSTPAGWYPDPQQPGQQRYWDGTTWTDSVSGGPATGPAGTTAVGYGYAQGGGAADASFGSRALAVILDGLIIGIPGAILYGIAFAISDALGILVYLAVIAAGIYYWGYFEGGPEGQTIGKRTLNIRTVDATTLQPGIGMGRAIGRYFARILSGFLCGLGYFWMLWDPEKQTWHDKLVTTKVVKA
jgi:uncharacterized RDD family membrane protein YckC